MTYGEMEKSEFISIREIEYAKVAIKNIPRKQNYIIR